MKNYGKQILSVTIQDRKTGAISVIKTEVVIQKNSSALSQLKDFVNVYRKMGYKVLSYKAHQIS